MIRKPIATRFLIHRVIWIWYKVVNRKWGWNRFSL